MITWGIASAPLPSCRTEQLPGVRFLLGVAEAGLFPGIVLLFTYWFPDHHRARIVSSFTLALAGLRGPWRAGLHGDPGLGRVPGLRRLEVDLHPGGDPDRADGRLRAVRDDRQARQGALAYVGGEELACRHAGAGARAVEAGGKFSLWQALVNPEDPASSLNYLGIVTASLGAAAVHATDHQVARRDQYGHRLCDDVCVHLWRDQHDDMGLDLRPYGRAALEPVLGLHLAASDWHWPA